jgi:hypothetical protein
MADDSLDQMIMAGTALLGIPVQPEWMPSIRANLEVSLKLGHLVDEFTLPDEAEPAPVYTP